MIERHDSLIVKKMSELFIPMIRLFAFYVFFLGHHSPGGGFQAGVLLGASFILQALVHPPEKPSSYFKKLLLAVIGLLIYAGIGVLALGFSGKYLDYGHLGWLGLPSQRRFWAILGVEAGVFFVVASTMVLIFECLSLPLEGDKKS